MNPKIAIPLIHELQTWHMLAIQNLRVEFGPRVLFSDLSFVVQAKEKISFAGHNGAGKSTLMKCIAGIIEQNAGDIVMPRGCEVGYLPQEGIHIKGISLFDETMKAFSGIQELQTRIDQKSAELEHLDSSSPQYLALLEEIGELELKLDGNDPAKIKPQVESVLKGLGFQQEDMQRDCSEFSGGWQMRIAMAKLFLQKPEVLLLDEPTNHLDFETQIWMENFLKSYPGAIILISHDRALLDTLTTRTIAFSKGRAEEYAGNYSFYEKESAHRKEILIKQYKAQQKEIAKAEDFVNRFRAKASKASQAQSRLKQLEKMERIEIEDDDAYMDFRFPDPPASMHSVVKLEGASKSYGDKVIFPSINLELTKGEKIAIVGPNGAGKSTFCKLITGEIEPTSGLIELGGKVLPSFFSQNHADELDPDKTVLETVEEVATREAAASARSMLGCFLFRGDDVFKKIGVLSGGERSRVALVRMLVKPANFLILDEPTNHLDMQSQDVLRNALSSYTGTIVIVSHNRDFLDPLAERTIEFTPAQEPKVYHGNLSYYLSKKEDEKNAHTTTQAATKSTPSGSSGVNRKEQRKREAEQRRIRKEKLAPLEQKLESLEEAIAEYEGAQATLTEHMNSPEIASNGEKMQETTMAYQAISDKLEKAYSDWSEVSESIEQISAQLDAMN